MIRFGSASLAGIAMATTRTHSCLTPSASTSSVSSSNRASANLDSPNIDTFPSGLRVLVVDDDPICLLILDRMLRHCQYQVTTCGKATDALGLLRENRDNFDVIISDVYMPDMDGFKLLELVGLEMDLPVIMMSANGETSAVMQGIKHGACDYLLKPVRMEELRNIWQHVVRKKWRSQGQTSNHEVDRTKQAADECEYNSPANEGFDGMWRQSKKRKGSTEEEEEAELDNDDLLSAKKPRVVWSVELHQQFVTAVNQLGIEKAVPKRILELMNVQGLTRENVASHLQKYRLYLKRISGAAHQSSALNPPFHVTCDSNFGPVNAAGLEGINNLQKLSGPSPQALVSTLQSEILGRSNMANLGMSHLDPSILLRIAALRGGGNPVVARPLTRAVLTSCGESVLNTQGSFQAGASDLNLSPLQVSQLGAFAGSLDKRPLGALSALEQQQQLAAMASADDLGQLPQGSNNQQQVNASKSALLMQTVQHQQVGGSNTGQFSMPTRSMRGQGGLPADMEPWAPSPLSMNASGQTSNSLRPLSCFPLGGGSMLGPSARVTDADSNGLHIGDAGQVARSNSTEIPSHLTLGGLHELSTVRTCPSGPSLSSSVLYQSYRSSFPSLLELEKEQESHAAQRSQRAQQGLNIREDLGILNDCPTNHHIFSVRQNQILGSERPAMWPRF